MPTQLDEQIPGLVGRVRSRCSNLRLVRDSLHDSPSAAAAVPSVAHAEGRIAHRLVEPFVRGRLRRRRQNGQRATTTVPRNRTYIRHTAIGLDEGRRLRSRDNVHDASVGSRRQTRRPNGGSPTPSQPGATRASTGRHGGANRVPRRRANPSTPPPAGASTRPTPAPIAIARPPSPPRGAQPSTKARGVSAPQVVSTSPGPPGECSRRRGRPFPGPRPPAAA